MKWKCKDGRVLSVSEMDTDHIKSAMAMLRRNQYVSAREFADAVCSTAGIGGEMASYYAEQEIAGMKPTQMLDEMEAELEKRARHARASSRRTTVSRSLSRAAFKALR